MIPSHRPGKQAKREKIVIFLIFLLVHAGICPIATAKAETSRPPAKNSSRPGHSEIPKKPSAPPALTAPVPTDTFRCQRFFVYQGKRLACDSNIRQDGENLRPLMEDVPQALAELDQYQKNRSQVRTAAYVGSVGLLVMVAGALLSLRYRQDGHPTDTSNSIRNLSVLAGGGIITGSFLSAQSFNKTNESHLGNAVRYYNQAHPEAPIELQFSATIGF